MWNVGITVLGISFIFIMTALGAAVAFLFKGEIPVQIHAFFLGFASGVMIAASVWSLLLPSIAQSERIWGKLSFFPAALGVLLGGLLLVLFDALMKKHSVGNTTWNKTHRLFLAITLHNIPEGLAVGFAFGAAVSDGGIGAFLSALMLAIGIGVQNFPEGAALALPLKMELNSNRKAFIYAAASGIVEPIFALVGYFLAAGLAIWQPWFLSFSAGAMLFVAADDLIPDAKSAKGSWGTWGVLLGFVIMMALDVALG